MPFDGRYESKYKNGKVLAKGNFNQGKPDGKWLFNYSTGKIQSVRYYNKGVEEGHWLMLSETGDTILYLEFIKGVLKRSKSFYYGRYDYENVGDIDTEIKTLEISRNDSLIQYDLKMYDNHRRLIVQSLIYSKKELINVSPAIPIVVDFSGFSSCLNTYECIDDITGSYVQRDSSGYIKCLVEFKNSQISSPFKLFYPNGKTMKETGMYDTDSGSFYMIKSYFPSGKIQEVTRVIKILKDKKESHYGYARDFFNYGEYEEEYIKWDEDGNIIKRYNGLNTLH